VSGRRWPSPPLNLPQPVMLKACLNCKGDMSWRPYEGDGEWICVSCGWDEFSKTKEEKGGR